MFDSTSKNVNGKCGRKSKQAACRDAVLQTDMVENTKLRSSLFQCSLQQRQPISKPIFPNPPALKSNTASFNNVRMQHVRGAFKF